LHQLASSTERCSRTLTEQFVRSAPVNEQYAPEQVDDLPSGESAHRNQGNSIDFRRYGPPAY
jgi:hypothetical protein